ncbi:hypothetical protein BJ742DRAFT_893749, partial [Cladochytrium replicatum]
TKLPHIVRQTAVQQRHVQQQICRAQVNSRNRLRTAPVLRRPLAYQCELKSREKNRIYLPSVAKGWTVRAPVSIKADQAGMSSDDPRAHVEEEMEAREVSNNEKPDFALPNPATPNLTLRSRHPSTTSTLNSIHTPSMPTHDEIPLVTEKAPLSIGVFRPGNIIHDRKSHESSSEDHPESPACVLFHPPRLNPPHKHDYLIFQQHFSYIAAETRRKNSSRVTSQIVTQPQSPIIHTRLKPLEEKEENKLLERTRVLPRVRSRQQQRSNREAIVGNSFGGGGEK